MLPRFEALDGFCSASMLVDRITGPHVRPVAFESREACDVSHEHVARFATKASVLPARRWST